MQRKIYITGGTGGDLQATRKKFAKAIRTIHDEYPNSITIHPLMFDITEDTSWPDAMDIRIEQLWGCDMLVTLHGWKTNRAARVEYRIARLMGKKILHLGTYDASDGKRKKEPCSQMVNENIDMTKKAEPNRCEGCRMAAYCPQHDPETCTLRKD